MRGTPERRKQREGTCTIVILKTKAPSVMKTSRGVNPAAVDCAGAIAMYFSTAGTSPRNRREQRGIPVAVDRIDVLGCSIGSREKIRGSGHACGQGDAVAKG